MKIFTVCRNSLFTSLVVVIVFLSGCSSIDSTEKFTIKPSVSGAPPETHLRAVKHAISLQGHPYTYGGESPEQGFDCSGLVYYVYQQQGILLPRDSWSLANQLPSVQVNERQPGDLVFFNTTSQPYSHVGIYIGHDQFIHAPSNQTGRVMQSSLHHPYWHERFTGIKRPRHRQKVDH